MVDVVDSFANKSLVTIPSLLGLDPEFRFEGTPARTHSVVRPQTVDVYRGQR